MSAFKQNSFRLPPEQQAIRDRCFHPTGTFVEFPIADVETSIPARFEKIVGLYPDRLAVKDGTRTFAYKQLNQAANRIARAVLEQAGTSDDPVALLFEHGAFIIAAILGILKTGRIYVPLDPVLPAARTFDLLQDSQAKLLLTNVKNLAQARSLAQQGQQVLNCDDIDASADGENLSRPIASQAPALILYTSGSTGRPKGVLHDHRNILVEASNYTNDVRICPEDRLSLCQSCSFANSIRNIYGALLNGASLFPYDLAAEGFSALPDWLGQQHITIFHTLATIVRRINEMIAPDSQFPDVRILRFGGEPSGAADVKYFQSHFAPGCVLMNVIGLTETFTIRRYFLAEKRRADETKVPLGYGVAGKDVLLLDEAGQEVATGQIGEMVVRSRYLAIGYWQRPDLTDAVFMDDPSGGGKRLYHTGDLGVMQDDGCLIHMGRQDFQVKIRGNRVEVTEVETALLRLAAVQAAVVQPQADSKGDLRLVAYIVPAAGQQPTLGEIRRALAPALPNAMLPAAVVLLNSLPVVPNGRIDRRALPAPSDFLPLPDTDYDAPATPVEEKVASIWAEVLALDRIGRHDDFLSLGGHSLAAMRIAARVLRDFKLELPLRRLFEAPTIAAMAGVITAFFDRPQSGAEAQAISRRERRTLAPLSCAQQRLWFLHQWNPQNPVYNESSTRRLRGALEVAALRQALDQIALRHEILRTKIVMDGETPAQMIDSDATVEFKLIDLRAQAASGREERARQLAVEMIRRPFDLALDLPWRALLLRLADDEHILLAVMHHIAFDGWSSQIFWRELALLYNALMAGQALPLEELPVQYQDYAEWQRRCLQGETLERQLAYWQRQLDGVAVLQLPVDRPRPAAQTFRGARHTVRFHKELAEALKSLSRQEGVTLFMTLLAAFQTLLHRIAGQEDIAVGCPVAGRTRPELENLVGFFINTLVLRARVTGDLSCRQLLQRVREGALSAYENQDVPFEKLVDQLQPERDPSRNPLFQVTFQLHNFTQAPVPMAGLKTEPVELDAGIAKFDLALKMTEDSQGLMADLDYNTDLFDAATIERMVGHFQNLLEGIVVDPERRVSELPILAERERQQLLVEWIDTKTDYPQDRCIHELFEAQEEKTPDTIAVVFEDEQLTYRELNSKANQLAHHLKKLGVGPDTLVGIFMERSLEMIVGLLGVLKAGGAYVAIDPGYPVERLKFMLDDAQVCVLLTKRHLIENRVEGRRSEPVLSEVEGMADRDPRSSIFDPRIQMVCLDRDRELIARERGANPENITTADNLAYVIYTSGSTGQPKGVAIEHRNTAAFLSWAHSAFTKEELSGVLASTSICFDLSVFEIFAPLTCGGTIIIAENALALTTIPNRSKVSLLNTVPSAMNELLRLDAIPPSVHVINLAGEPLRTELVRRIYESTSVHKVHDLYGPSESTTYSTWTCRSADGPQTIGRPIANTRVYILNSYRKPVPIGVVGEIYIGGDGVARGYLNRPELTAERFIYHSFDGGPERRLYKTGDLARYLPDGNIEFLGRIDNQVKIRGFRIELGEIETVLGQHPGVRQSAVIACEDSVGERRLVAYVVPKESAPAELRTFLKAKFPDYMVPTGFIFLDSLPLTTTGKVDRNALPIPACDGFEVERIYIAPRNAAEQIIAGIWAKVLGRKRIGIHDNFFDLGGHSLKATQVIARLRKAFHSEISLRHLFEFPTIAKLAVVIDSKAVDGLNRVRSDRLLSKVEERSGLEAQNLVAQKAAARSTD